MTFTRILRYPSFGWLKRYVPRSLYGRAALILLTPIITVQLVLSVVFIQRHYEDVTVQMTRSVALELEVIRDHVAEGRADAARALAEALRLDLEVPAERPPTTDRRQFYDLSGRKVIETLRAELPGITGIALLQDGNRVVVGLPTARGTAVVVIPRSRVSASNPHQLLVLTGFVSLLMSVIAFLFLRNQVRPIKRLAEAAQAFGRGRVHPYRATGATEVRAAGAAFLDMRHRIERQIEQRTLILSGVSHDLRTPLTRMRLGLSMMDNEPETAALLDDLRAMEQMLDTFLDFARSDTLDDATEVDPGALIAEIAAQAARMGQDVTVREAPVGERAMLRPIAVRRALQNLVGNAVRYGTRAELSCTQSDRAVVFSVEDDGPGIAPEDREAAQKPFNRLDPARNQDRGGSVGLGLSIASDIARQHGGMLRLESSERLGGLRADLVLAR